MDATSSAEPSRPLRVFVVENHPDTLRSLQMYLEVMGYEVRWASTVAGAIEAFPRSGCDVLISDIGLPDGNGWELLQALREQGHPPAFSIAMSGFGMNADQLHSQEAGFRHHLLKPFVPAELDGMLKEAAGEIRAAR